VAIITHSGDNPPGQSLNNTILMKRGERARAVGNNRAVPLLHLTNAHQMRLKVPFAGLAELMLALLEKRGR
jgi:hypothetical protein